MEFKTPAELAPKIDVGFVGSMLGKVFGFNSPIYLPYELSTRMYEPGGWIYEQTEDYNEYDDGPDSVSRFGQKVLHPFWFEGGTYKGWDIMTGKIIPVKVGDFLCPLASIVDFSIDKSIAETPVIGGYGTVKEIVSMNDWNVSIKGIIFHDGERKNSYSSIKAQMDVLQIYSSIAGAIKVRGIPFYNRGISRIVIKSLSFSPIQGKPGIMPYTIEAVSDLDELLIIKP